MSGKSQAKAWALREVWRDDKKPNYGMLPYICSKVKKVGGGHPSTSAMSQFFEKIDDDADWFPGKVTREAYGPEKLLTGAKRAAIARSAMAMKESGMEPTYSRVIAACPNATRNPDTGKPVSKNLIYDIFENDCYDDDPEHAWYHRARFSKVALTEDVMEKRLAFAKLVIGWNHTGAWYFNHVVWTDLCNSILPRTEKRANDMALACKGGKGWGSDGCELMDLNLKGKSQSLKQNSWDTIRVWWAPVLSRGKFHIEVFNADFAGESPAGVSKLVEKVRAGVNRRFQNEDSKPDVLFTDRGRGFYATGNGKITAEYKEALQKHNFDCMMGDDGAAQPGSLSEVLLHETAVSWMRVRLRNSTPSRSWEETREAYGNRLKRCCDQINKDLKVEELCRAFPKRIQLLEEREGGRLR